MKECNNCCPCKRNTYTKITYLILFKGRKGVWLTVYRIKIHQRNKKSRSNKFRKHFPSLFLIFITITKNTLGYMFGGRVYEGMYCNINLDPRLATKNNYTGLKKLCGNRCANMTRLPLRV